MKQIACIFEDVVGYYVADDAGPLYTGGPEYKTKVAAMMAAYSMGYLYAHGSGTYWREPVRIIPKYIRDDVDKEQ